MKRAPRRTTVAWLALATLACAAAAGCAVTNTQRREEQLILNARSFNDDWRWGRWNTMAGMMPPEDGKAFLGRTQALESELELADFEVMSIDFIEASQAAKVVARFEWYLKHDPRVRKTTVEQRWENHEGRWLVVKLRRTRGDRFGLVPEPLAGTADPEAAGTPAAPH